MTNPFFDQMLDLLFTTLTATRATVLDGMREQRQAGVPAEQAYEELLVLCEASMQQCRALIETTGVEPTRAIMSATADAVLLLIEAGYPLDDILPALRATTTLTQIAKRRAAP